MLGKMISRTQATIFSTLGAQLLESISEVMLMWSCVYRADALATPILFTMVYLLKHNGAVGGPLFRYGSSVVF